MHLFLRTLGLSLFLGLSPAYSAFAETIEFEVGGIRYETLGEHVRVIAREGKYSGKIVIPETVVYEGNTYTVTSIGGVPQDNSKKGAFQNCSELTEIVIPKNVTEIGANAFDSCTSLTDIALPPAVNKVNTEAFMGCTNLKSVTLSESLTFLGSNAFFGCKNLERVICPRQTPPNQIGFNNRAFDIENYNNTILTASQTMKITLLCMG